MRKISGIFILLFVTASCLWPCKAVAQQYSDTTYSIDTTSAIDEDEETDTAIALEDTDTASGFSPLFRRLSSDSLMALKNDKDFSYMAYLDSMLKAQEDARTKRPEQVKQPEQEQGWSFFEIPVVKYLFWIIAIGIVGFVLVKLFKGEGGMFVTNKSGNIPEITTEQEIPEDDLEGLLQRAIRNANYRLAVRYLFLKMINRLGEKGILQLSTEKTNYQYASELQGKPYANSFSRLCLQYEYVWFGEFEINKEQFESVQLQHQQFLKEI